MAKLYRREMHFLKDFDNNPIAFDVGSSSVIYLDDVSQKILYLGSEIEENILERFNVVFCEKTKTKKTIDRLKKIGILSLTPQKQEETVSENETFVRGVSFNISHRCNMACGYCFGGGGCYGGPAVDMDRNILKAGIDFLFNGHNLASRIISFFGGEPFLNWEAMQRAIKYAQSIADIRGIGLVFFITTNGTLLTKDMLDFLSQKNVKLIISMDGPKEIHNKERKFFGGAGTHDVVERNVKIILRDYPGISLQIRPTITPYSCGKIKEIYHHLRSIGVNRMHARPESRYGERSGLSHDEYRVLLSEFEELSIEMIDASDGGDYWGLINILKFLNMLYFGVIKHDYCGAGVSIISISPDGSIFPCPRFTGTKEFLLGNILSGLDNEKRMFFINNSVDSRSDCRGCWARYVCGGGCSYMHWVANNDYKKNDPMWCDWTRKSIEIAIKVYAKLQEGRADKMKKFFLLHTPFLSDFGEEVSELLTSIFKERR